MTPRAASLPSASPSLAGPFVAGMLLLVACVASGTASARSSDRSKPMDVESNTNTCTLDDSGQCTLTGNVVITQGTLDIRSAKAVLYRSGGDPSRAVLSGSPATLKQQMDDGTPMTARASNVDYDMRTEVVVFTGNVVIEQPRGTLRGARVVYNLRTGQVTSGGEAGGRVKMTIQPKSAQGTR